MAIIGLTHPGALTSATAAHWATMHTVLIPFFPLVGLDLVWLVAGLGGRLSWIVRIAAFVYAVCYPAVDLLAGVAAGLLVTLGEEPLSPAVMAMFARGNAVGDVGVAALWISAVLTLVALYPTLRRRVIPGGLLLLAGAYLFGEHHIYRPWGVLGMALLALGFAALLRVRQVVVLEAEFAHSRPRRG